MSIISRFVKLKSGDVESIVPKRSSEGHGSMKGKRQKGDRALGFGVTRQQIEPYWRWLASLEAIGLEEVFDTGNSVVIRDMGA
jgi:hypothetical protein